MELMRKLEILGAAAKYDVSCASSGSDRRGVPGMLGNACSAGICHSFTEDGRCISLLKVLLSNDCVFDCKYCVNRRSNDVPRAFFTPRELASLTVEFYRRNYIEGLFLSSAVVGNPDRTMELLLETLRLLRGEFRFNGYVHMKIIPNADPALVEQAGLMADRMSVNMEFCSRRSLETLTTGKTFDNILTPMRYVRTRLEENQYDIVRYRGAPKFAPAGQSTQFIVGATPENDRRILGVTSKLYTDYRLKRVYYSAYVPVASDPLLPVPFGFQTPLRREHRLYQADWLLRFYRFSVDEIVTDREPDLPLDVDTKTAYALRHPDLYPVDVNRAPYELLLRVPGIGKVSAERIVRARRFSRLDEVSLKRIGVVLKRAQYFLEFGGRILGRVGPDYAGLREILRDGSAYEQVRLF